MLADPAGEFTKALGADMLFEAPVLGYPRTRRYVMVVDDGVIKAFAAENKGDLQCSRSSDAIKLLESVYGRK